MKRVYIYAIASVVLLAIGVGFGWYFGSLSSKNDLNALKAQNWQAKYVAVNTVNAKLAADLNTAKAIAAHNSEVIRDLESKTVSTESERDNAQRLLDAARRSFATAIGSLSETHGGQPAPAAGGAPGDDALRDLLAATGAECKRNANRLDALSAEIKPQL